MRAASLLAACLCLSLAACVGTDEDVSTGSLKPVLTTPSSQPAATAPVGLWDGGLTMLVMTTRDLAGPADPWFGSSRAADPTAARTILYPPKKTLLASVNPIASTDWSVAGVEPMKGDAATAIANAAQGKDVLLY